MARSGVQAPLRVLNLTLNLIHSPQGLTLEELIRTVPGYLPAEAGSARRKFERDVEQLRGVGLVVTVTSGANPRYSINSASFSADTAALSQDEVLLLLRAANAWGMAEPELTALRYKLHGHSQGPLPAQAEPALSLDQADLVETLISALESRRLLEFDYAGRRGTSSRTVIPWRIIARGRALYLWGFDMDRWDARLFRLSRFTTGARLLGQPGDGAPVDAFQEVPFEGDDFLTAPLMLVRRQSAPACFARSQQASAPEGAAAISGWELRRGLLDDAAIWENLLLREAEGALALEPGWLRESVRSNLVQAAHWRAGADG